MKRKHITVAILSLAAMLGCCRASLAASSEEIEASLQRAKAFLYAKQKNGNWEPKQAVPKDEDVKKSPASITAGQWGEQTALATYSLLAAGESPQNEKLIAPIKFLLANDLKGVYALGAKTQIYSFLPLTQEVHAKATDDWRKLRDAQLKEGPATGLYDRLLDPGKSTRVDHSVSLYGFLGAAACEDANVEEGSDYWVRVEKAWTRDQDAASGGWGLEDKPSTKNPISASMTAAGLTALFVTQDHLHADNGVNCRGNITSPAIEAGLAWFSKNFDKVFTDRTQRYSPYSTLFDVERVGDASGLKFFGDVNWYEAGVDYLLKQQQADGSWGRDVPNTCYGILFLSHGRAPVVMNKLQYDINGAAGPWNQRPRDAANVVHFISKRTERDLNWQIVHLQASLAELHEAPILYIAGNQSLQFGDEEVRKLRQFCEEGGIIYGNADCGNADFTTSFRKLAAALFPRYEFRDLPADHPIYTSEQYLSSKWKDPPVVHALSNGVRELMVLHPNADVGRAWQLDDPSGNQFAFEFTNNLFLYAVDKQNLLEKGKTYLVYDDPKVKTKRTLKVGRLEYDGNWDPEPAGWRRMSSILHNAGDKLELFPIKLGANKLGNGHGVGVHVAHLTGTTRFKFTDAIRQEIKSFVEGGGTLIVDAAGGAGEFAESVESELVAMFGGDVPNQLKQPLPPTHAIYNLPGGKIEEFGYRPFTRRVVGQLKGPQVKAIKVGGDRAGVYYSREDLSGGMVGESIDGIIGYDPATATAIMRNLILYGTLGEKATFANSTTAPVAESAASVVATPAAPADTQPQPAQASPDTATTKPAKKASSKKKSPTTKKAG